MSSFVEADIAMYDAKNAGKDRHAVYDRTEGRSKLMSMRQSWNERLHRALSDDTFVLHAQPITAICANATPWFELLLRLPDDHGDLIPSGTFLYNAERFGLIEQIDRWVLERAVRHLHDSHAAGSDLALSVNVSGTTMGDPELAAHVTRLLSANPIAPDRLAASSSATSAPRLPTSSSSRQSSRSRMVWERPRSPSSSATIPPSTASSNLASTTRRATTSGVPAPSIKP